VGQKTNSNEGFNRDAHDKKLMSVNDTKQQKSYDSNSGARIGGMS
jgi:hypothetical protein